MERVSLSDAKAHLSELISRVERGDEIQIVRRGKLVARLSPPEARRTKPGIDIEALRRLTQDMPFQEQGAGAFVRAMRDDDRY